MFGPALVFAFLLVGLMGAAIQRGSTCLVAAVDEIVTHRTAHRLQWILVAGLLSGTVVGLAAPSGGAGMPVPGLGLTLLGAVLLGVGALVNRACVVGTIARIGSGEWAFLATPLGILAASLALAESPVQPPAAGFAMSHARAGPVAAVLLAALLLPALVTHIRARRSGAPPPVALRPHLATAAIGLLFAALALLGSPWSYADALAHLGRTGMADRPALNLALVATLIGSAWIAGRAGGAQMRPTQRPRHILRCFAGGAILATGALLVPGSNDGLLLHGAPMLQLHALIALPVMALTIAIGQALQRRLDRTSRASAAIPTP